MSARLVGIEAQWEPDGLSLEEVVQEMAEELAYYVVAHGMAPLTLKLRLSAEPLGDQP